MPQYERQDLTRLLSDQLNAAPVQFMWVFVPTPSVRSKARRAVIPPVGTVVLDAPVTVMAPRDRARIILTSERLVMVAAKAGLVRRCQLSVICVEGPA